MHNPNRFKLRSLVGLILVSLALLLTMTPQLTHAQVTHAQTTQQSPQHRKPHGLRKPGSLVPAASGPLTYHGGPVMSGGTLVYTIFWQPTNNVASDYQSLINRYFNDVGRSPLYGLNVEYPQSNGAYSTDSLLAGTWTDHRPYPGGALNPVDIQNEVIAAIIAHNTTPAPTTWVPNPQTIFFVFTERNEDVCLTSTQCASTPPSNGICGYHQSFPSTGTNIIYAAMPYAADFSCSPGSSPNNSDADATINVTSHEQMEAATDPLGNAWYASDGSEIGDKCVWQFGPHDALGADVNWNDHQYLVQNEYNNATNSCLLAAGLTVSSGGNRLFALSPAKDGIWQYSGSNATWIKIGGPARAIYGGGFGLFATDPNTGNLYQYLGTPMSWRQIGGPALSFAVSNSAIFSMDHLGVWQWSGVPGNWIKIGNPAGRLYVGDPGIFVTDPNNGNLLQYWQGGWRQIGGPAMSFTISSLGLFSLDNLGIWKWSGVPGNWIQISTPAGTFYSGGIALIATALGNGNLYQYGGTSWGQIGGPAQSFTVSNSAIYSRDSLGVWQYSGSPLNWIKIGNPASSFTIA